MQENICPHVLSLISALLLYTVNKVFITVVSRYKELIQKAAELILHQNHGLFDQIMHTTSNQ